MTNCPGVGTCYFNGELARKTTLQSDVLPKTDRHKLNPSCPTAQGSEICAIGQAYLPSPYFLPGTANYGGRGEDAEVEEEYAGQKETEGTEMRSLRITSHC